jgi:hypothetical protein
MPAMLTFPSISLEIRERDEDIAQGLLNEIDDLGHEIEGLEELDATLHDCSRPVDPAANDRWRRALHAWANGTGANPGPRPPWTLDDIAAAFYAILEAKRRRLDEARRELDDMGGWL